MHADGLAGMGHAVENLFWQDLKANRAMKKYLMKGQTLEEEEPIGTFSIGTCDYREEMENDGLNELFRANAPRVAVRMVKNASLIDFAGPNRKVYQVTVSNRHNMSILGLTKLFLSSGHCVMLNNKIVKARDAGQLVKIYFYWVVPPGKATAWIDKAPKTIVPGKSQDEESDSTTPLAGKGLLKECLANYVIQRILVMDTAPTVVSTDVPTV